MKIRNKLFRDCGLVHFTLLVFLVSSTLGPLSPAWAAEYQPRNAPPQAPAKPASSTPNGTNPPSVPSTASAYSLPSISGQTTFLLRPTTPSTPNQQGQGMGIPQAEQERFFSQNPLELSFKTKTKTGSGIRGTPGYRVTQIHIDCPPQQKNPKCDLVFAGGSSVSSVRLPFTLSPTGLLTGVINSQDNIQLRYGGMPIDRITYIQDPKTKEFVVSFWDGYNGHLAALRFPPLTLSANANQAAPVVTTLPYVPGVRMTGPATLEIRSGSNSPVVSLLNTTGNATPTDSAARNAMQQAANQATTSVATPDSATRQAMRDAAIRQAMVNATQRQPNITTQTPTSFTPPSSSGALTPDSTNSNLTLMPAATMVATTVTPQVRPLTPAPAGSLVTLPGVRENTNGVASTMEIRSDSNRNAPAESLLNTTGNTAPTDSAAETASTWGNTGAWGNLGSRPSGADGNSDSTGGSFAAAETNQAPVETRLPGNPTQVQNPTTLEASTGQGTSDWVNFFWDATPTVTNTSSSDATPLPETTFDYVGPTHPSAPLPDNLRQAIRDAIIEELTNSGLDSKSIQWIVENFDWDGLLPPPAALPAVPPEAPPVFQLTSNPDINSNAPRLSVSPTGAGAYHFIQLISLIVLEKFPLIIDMKAS